MAMARIGIERHVDHDADVGNLFLDGARRPAHQIVAVEGLAAGRVAQGRIGIGKQGDERNAERRGLCGVADRLVDRQPLHAGHGLHGVAPVVAIDQKQRPDQIVDAQRRLAVEPARPVGAPVAAQPPAFGDAVDVGAGGQLEGSGHDRPGCCCRLRC